MKGVLSAVFFALLPVICSAADLDEQLKCGVSAHEFIGSLEQQQLIDPAPTRVEPNSINAFRPASGATLTAYGFHVFAIVGYQKNDPLFRTGDGKPISDSAYGAVVFGWLDSVRAAVTAAHSTAVVHKVAPHITAIFCNQD
ncbi:hypothetical protein FAZ69_02265 [Trinickia terrae]|uniref:Uncharacterized protein n=1 Tax=Trinickia terrae TaxID=2571161 RepID=A0A4U1IG27_9BURK|nr:hypothetical protein FAZ69_02265 [Trinickia terrae]